MRSLNNLEYQCVMCSSVLGDGEKQPVLLSTGQLILLLGLLGCTSCLFTIAVGIAICLGIRRARRNKLTASPDASAAPQEDLEMTLGASDVQHQADNVPTEEVLDDMLESSVVVQPIDASSNESNAADDSVLTEGVIDSMMETSFARQPIDASSQQSNVTDDHVREGASNDGDSISFRCSPGHVIPATEEFYAATVIHPPSPRPRPISLSSDNPDSFGYTNMAGSDAETTSVANVNQSPSEAITGSRATLCKRNSAVSWHPLVCCSTISEYE